MRLKDIASLSQVSVSTVSKIINDKAEGIPAETRQKVLKIAREGHYTPYSNIKRETRRHYLFGLLVTLGEAITPWRLGCLEKAAQEAGYRLVVSDAAAAQRDPERRLRLLADSADGVILLDRDRDGLIRRWLADHKIPAVAIDPEPVDGPEVPAVSIGWGTAAAMAAEYLEGLGHRCIGLLSADLATDRARQAIASLERHYSARETVYDHKLSVTPKALPTLLQAGATALICSGLGAAADFYRFAWEQHMALPQEMSVVAIDGGDGAGGPFLPPLARVALDCQALAREAVENLASIVEGGSAITSAQGAFSIVPGDSVAQRQGLSGTASNILVVGPLNVDVMINVRRMPSPGETAPINSLASLPGGKGANQAIGIARLGGTAALIGRIGRDSGGRVLYKALRDGGVDTRGVSIDYQVETGKAYINVDTNGDNFIQVYGGANRTLERRHLERNEELFRTASYCLVQSELPAPIYTQAVDFAYRHGVPVILKPCTVDAIQPEVLRKVFLLVPNQMEAERLAGPGKGLKEQAGIFLAAGAANVIITLAERGCFYASGKGSQMYPAYGEKGLVQVDASGASDAFISALALSLAEGNPMDTAIRFAQVAGALSVGQKGVQSSLPDRAQVEMRSFYYQPDNAGAPNG